MPFVVRNKETGLYAKVGRRSYYTKWIPDINDATVYKSKSAALNSRGTHVKNPKRHEAYLAAKELSEKFNKEYGPFDGVTRINRTTGEEEVLNAGWPNTARFEYSAANRRYHREPFGHMVLPANLEILPVSFVQVGPVLLGTEK
jgi:hypothetical protein